MLWLAVGDRADAAANLRNGNLDADDPRYSRPDPLTFMVMLERETAMTDDFLFLTKGKAAKYLSCSRDELIAWVKPGRPCGRLDRLPERGAGPNRPSIARGATSKRGAPAIAPKQPNALR